MPALLHAPKAGEKVNIEVRYYGDKPGAYKLYDDDGETFNFERGELSWREIKVEPTKNGQIKGTVSAPIKGKPNTIGKVTFRKMTNS